MDAREAGRKSGSEEAREVYTQAQNEGMMRAGRKEVSKEGQRGRKGSKGRKEGRHTKREW